MNSTQSKPTRLIDTTAALNASRAGSQKIKLTSSKLAPIVCYLLLYLLTVLSSVQHAQAQPKAADSVTVRSANALLAQIAYLIKEHAYFNGVSVVFRYEAYADTTRGLKLYVGEEMGLLGDADKMAWHYINFAQPIQAGELKVMAAKNGSFTIDAAKRITKKIKQRVGSEGSTARERNARLLIPFWVSPKKRTVDFEQLQAELTQLISQLLQHQEAKRVRYGLKG